jgi:hypothetical protein
MEIAARGLAKLKEKDLDAILEFLDTLRSPTRSMSSTSEVREAMSAALYVRNQIGASLDVRSPFLMLLWNSSFS